MGYTHYLPRCRGCLKWVPLTRENLTFAYNQACVQTYTTVSRPCTPDQPCSGHNGQLEEVPNMPLPYWYWCGECGQQACERCWRLGIEHQCQFADGSAKCRCCIRDEQSDGRLRVCRRDENTATFTEMSALPTIHPGLDLRHVFPNIASVLHEADKPYGYQFLPPLSQFHLGKRILPQPGGLPTKISCSPCEQAGLPCLPVVDRYGRNDLTVPCKNCESRWLSERDCVFIKDSDSPCGLCKSIGLPCYLYRYVGKWTRVCQNCRIRQVQAKTCRPASEVQHERGTMIQGGSIMCKNCFEHNLVCNGHVRRCDSCRIKRVQCELRFNDDPQVNGEIACSICAGQNRPCLLYEGARKCAPCADSGDRCNIHTVLEYRTRTGAQNRTASQLMPPPPVPGHVAADRRPSTTSTAAATSSSMASNSTQSSDASSSTASADTYTGNRPQWSGTGSRQLSIASSAAESESSASTASTTQSEYDQREWQRQLAAQRYGQ